MEEDENVYVNAHPRKKSKERLRREYAEAKAEAHQQYAEKIASGALTRETLDTLLDRIPLELFAEAASLIALMDENRRVRSDQAVVVGHSFGAQASIVAAFLRPDLFPRHGEDRSTLILLNPAGFTGKKEKPAAIDATVASERVDERHQREVGEMFAAYGRAGTLQARYIASLFGTALSRGKDGLRAFVHGVRYSAAHLLSGEIDREARAMANTDMVPFVNFLVAMNDVRIVVVYDEHDTTFPASAIEARRDEMPNVEFQKTSEKGHFGPVHDPKGTAKLVSAILKETSSQEKEEKTIAA